MSFRQSLLAALCIAGFALAQAPTEPPADLPESIKSAAPETWTQVTEPAIQTIRSSVGQVNAKLAEAQAQRDIVKLNCVNAKLTRMKGLLRISEESNGKIMSAVPTKNGEAAEHEWTKIRLAHETIKKLEFEAEQCLGQTAFRTEEQQSVDVEIPVLPLEGDPTTPTTVGDVAAIAPGQPSSPTR
jgi:hypothetical protein